MGPESGARQPGAGRTEPGDLTAPDGAITDDAGTPRGMFDRCTSATGTAMPATSRKTSE
jgi:hypothetical protein